jgi:hypothetical protein
MQKNIAPRWGAAAATRASTNMPPRWGEVDFFSHLLNCGSLILTYDGRTPSTLRKTRK